MLNKETSIVIRPMELDDLSGVLSIERLSFPTPWSRQAFLGELTENDFAYYYVGVTKDKLVGYAGMWIILDEAHVTNVAVHHDYRENSIGRRLMLELMQNAIVLGANRITLEVRPSNTTARHLYTNMGFVPAGIRKAYYTDTGEDALIMWKHLYINQKV